MASPTRRLAWLGVLLPGLGHVLVLLVVTASRRSARRSSERALTHLRPGDALEGVTLLTLVGILAWAVGIGLGAGDTWVIAGLDRLFDNPAGLQRALDGLIGSGLTLPRPLRDLAPHAALGLAAAPFITFLLWRRAVRFARREPYPPKPTTTLGVFQQAFHQNPAARFGLAGLLVLGALVLFTPWIAPYDPSLAIGARDAAPGWHTLGATEVFTLFGTDGNGRDTFTRVLYGGRISLFIGIGSVTVAILIGTLVGGVAGYFRGLTDAALMLVVDFMLSLPRLVLLLAILGILRTRTFSESGKALLVIGVLSLTGWMAIARLVRSEVLSVSARDYITAARALGLPERRVFFVHILPNLLGTLVVYASLAIGSTILVEAGLSFLGLGLSDPTPSWGTLIDAGRSSFHRAPWGTTFPGLAIVWTVMCFNLIGDGIRDAIDPRLRS